jgi:hypothetical protein
MEIEHILLKDMFKDVVCWYLLLLDTVYYLEYSFWNEHSAQFVVYFPCLMLCYNFTIQSL